jgi:hypothetical protein
VDLGQAFVADPEASEVVEVGEAAFDDPALCAQAGAVCDAAPRDDRGDPAGAQQPAVLVEVIAAVGQQPVGLLAWSSRFALDRSGLEVVEERDQADDVVAVAAGQLDGQRDAGRVDQQMML